jgi:hypothetical protein
MELNFSPPTGQGTFGVCQDSVVRLFIWRTPWYWTLLERLPRGRLTARRWFIRTETTYFWPEAMAPKRASLSPSRVNPMLRSFPPMKRSSGSAWRKRRPARVPSGRSPRKAQICTLCFQVCVLRPTRITASGLQMEGTSSSSQAARYGPFRKGRLLSQIHGEAHSDDR